MANQISRNAACPCGSGRKYKHCCFCKGFVWCHNDDDELCRVLPFAPDLVDVFQAHVHDVEKRRGAPLGPDDLLFPELAETGEAELTARIVRTMAKARIDPALIYAFEQTGLLVTDDNRDVIPSTDVAEWEAAVHEFRVRQN